MSTEYDDVDEAQDAIQKMRNSIRSAIKGDCIIVYDAFEYGDDGIPIDNLDEIAVMGKTRSDLSTHLPDTHLTHDFL